MMMKFEKLLGEIGIELRFPRQRTQTFDLPRFAFRIGRRHVVLGFEPPDGLRAFEPLGQQMDQRRIDIVDAVAQTQKFGIDGRHRLPLGNATASLMR